MGGLIGRVLVSVLVNKASKSVTAWVGAATAGAGVAAIVDPQLVALVPESLRPYALAALGVGVVLARHRQDITAMYTEAKAAIEAAKNPPK